MAKQVINIGTGELTGDGETLRTAFDKANDNFTELYNDDAADFDGAFASLTGKPTTLSGYGITDGGDVTASSTDTFTNKSGSNSQWTNDEGFTTLALGTSSTTALAGDTALFDGAYGSLTGTPTLGTVASTAATAYATSAQGLSLIHI